jgi:hypothetical protein
MSYRGGATLMIQAKRKLIQYDRRLSLPYFFLENHHNPLCR